MVLISSKKNLTMICQKAIKSFIFFAIARAGTPPSTTTLLSTGDETTWSEKGIHRRIEVKEPPLKEVGNAQAQKLHRRVEWSPSRPRITAAKLCCHVGTPQFSSSKLPGRSRSRRPPLQSATTTALEGSTNQISISTYNGLIQQEGNEISSLHLQL
jgi:hypothetical protein